LSAARDWSPVDLYALLPFVAVFDAP